MNKPFGYLSEKAKEIIFSFSLQNKDFSENYTKKLNNSGQVSSAFGYLKELIMPLAIEIGEGLIKNLDETVFLSYKKFGELRNSNNLYDREIALRLSQLIIVIGILRKTKEGNEFLDILSKHAGEAWVQYKIALEQKTERKIDYKKFKIIPTNQETGQHVIVDAIITKQNKNGEYEFLDGFSIKFNGRANKDITLKEGSFKTNVSAYYKQSASEELQNLGKEIDVIYDRSKIESSEKKLQTDKFIKMVSGEINELYDKKLGLSEYDFDKGTDNRSIEQVQLSEDLCNSMIERFNKFNDDFRFKDVILTVSSVNVDGSVDFYQAQSSVLRKEFENWINKGPVSVRMNKSKKYKINGKTFYSYGSMDFIGGPVEDQKVWLRQEVRHSNKIGVRLRSPFNFMKYLFEMADKKDKKTQASIKAINKVGGFLPQPLMIKAKSGLVSGLSTPHITLGLYRPGSKYVNKKVTGSGKVEYLYRKEDVRRKDKEAEEKDQISERKEAFHMKTDSSENEFKALFKQACSEIPEEHFIMLDTGISSVRITKDSETYFDFLGASSEQRQSAEFGSSSGSYNVTNGKIAYNISNISEGLPETSKKRLILHEVGHGFFFATVRAKDNKPISVEGFKNFDKVYVKNCAKFVDSFGKLDKEMRKSLDEELSMFKGDEQNQALIQKTNEIFVDYYASIDDFEHFAQAFAYYFSLPEELNRKEPDTYKLFNEFFKKYT